MTEGDLIPYPFEEIAGTMKPQHEGVPMTENEAYYLHEYIDSMVDRLIAGLDEEIARRKKSDEYQKRTLPELY